VEADPLGFLQRLDQVTRHREVGAFGSDRGKTVVDDFQFGQSSKYNKAMSMRTTVNLDPCCKVKS
jgi:hypothetical protein